MLNHKAGNDPHDHLRPASAIVSAVAPSPVARLANHAKSFALTPGLYWEFEVEIEIWTIITCRCSCELSIVYLHPISHFICCSKKAPYQSQENEVLITFPPLYLQIKCVFFLSGSPRTTSLMNYLGVLEARLLHSSPKMWTLRYLSF